MPEFAAVSDVSFSLRRRETLTILGESGSGKSVTLKALLGLLPTQAKVTGSVKLAGESILGLPSSDLARLRGRRISSMVFQEPITALDPVYTIGAQIAETIVRHEGTDRHTARARARALLERVRIPAAERRLGQLARTRNVGRYAPAGHDRAWRSPARRMCCWPMSLTDRARWSPCKSRSLLLLRQLQQELGMAIVFVTHDVGVAAEISDRVAVMYAGRFIETGSARGRSFRAPQHPRTRQGWLELRRPWRTARRRAPRDPRRAARPRRFACRLCLRPALPPRRRCLPS